MFIRSPKYPCDMDELKKIESLIDKIEIYESKVLKLHSLLTDEAEKTARDFSAGIKAANIIDMIFKCFFIEIENKEFSIERRNRFLAETVWDEIITKRNPPCEICGENRAIDKCHIVPNKIGGGMEVDNLLFLCPTHHRLFDRFMLSRSEWCVINWGLKSLASQDYILKVTKVQQEAFWSSIECGVYRKNSDAHMNFNDYHQFIYSVILKIKMLFNEDAFSPLENIKDMLKGNTFSISMKAIDVLVSHGCILKLKYRNGYLVAFPCGMDEIPESVLKEVHSKYF
ncbi:TPA: HNH endonuclease signature motif containing protein [Serratia fonticola]